MKKEKKSLDKKKEILKNKESSIENELDISRYMTVEPIKQTNQLGKDQRDNADLNDGKVQVNYPNT